MEVLCWSSVHLTMAVTKLQLVLVGHDNPTPSPWCKWFLDLDQPTSFHTLTVGTWSEPNTHSHRGEKRIRLTQSGDMESVLHTQWGQIRLHRDREPALHTLRWQIRLHTLWGQGNSLTHIVGIGNQSCTHRGEKAIRLTHNVGTGNEAFTHCGMQPKGVGVGPKPGTLTCTYAILTTFQLLKRRWPRDFLAELPWHASQSLYSICDARRTQDKSVPKEDNATYSGLILYNESGTKKGW